MRGGISSSQPLSKRGHVRALQDLLPMADRDTRVVGQDLSWSLSTGNFRYLVVRITPDWIRCFGQRTFRYPNRDGNIGAGYLHVFSYVCDFPLFGRCRALGIGTYRRNACRQRDD